jgi:3',5'-cyclic AMP phosphodiesterase CpdA
MKFIHLTDSHVAGSGATLYGADPARRLRLAVDSINAEHPDAAFVVVTGDLTHWGEPEAYAAFKAEIDRLRVPFHLMVGNHDDTPALAEAFPDVPRDADGFVQSAFDTPAGRALLLDTRTEGSAAGSYCARRRAWLAERLAETDDPLLIFMHHPPLKLGIPGMDRIRLMEEDAFAEVLVPHAARIRHIFFGHVHRPIFGEWRGISFSCMRGLNHQVALDLAGPAEWIPGNLEAPAYGVVLADERSIVVHMHEFAYDGPRFMLQAPDGSEPQAYILGMRHEGWREPG